MRRARAWVPLVVVCVVPGLLVACSGRDTTTPVPTEAAAPFMCDGVPALGVELLTGAPDAEVTQEGQWGSDERNFYCTVTVEQEPGLFRGLTVTEQRVAVSIFGDAATAEEELRATSGQVIDADESGVGAVYGSTEGTLTAAWACGERVLWVEVQGVFDDGRAAEEDLSNLLVSMLPWVCGDDDVPARTVEGR